MKKAITLIEIMITMMISSVVIMAAYSFFNVSARSWEYSSARMDASTTSIFVIESLDRIIKENQINVDRWRFGASDEFPGLSDVTGDALLEEERPGICYRDAVFLSFESNDRIPSHSKIIGLYRNQTGEVVLWRNIYDFKVKSMVQSIDILGRNVAAMDFTFLDDNWDTRELWSGPQEWYESKEIVTWLSVKVNCEVGGEVSENERIISVWR